MIHSQQQLEKIIAEWGFLPFFRCGIDGFSIEEMTPEELWFNDERPGPWEWKGPIIGNWQCAYGKFFAGKAGYISLEWMPDFINWRRGIYPIEKKSSEARHVYEVLKEHESMLSHELKLASGYSLRRTNRRPVRNISDLAERDSQRKNDTDKETKPKGSTCDALIAELEMATYVCIADFEYKMTKDGRRYGWGVARYCTPEAMYGEGITHTDSTPRESQERIAKHIKQLFPQATDKQISRLL
ncbi:MAG: hypothetical protein K6D59_03245 [Bacteroidales bacterium]|nr:hypothetical protein [Bacteroidales bacterium]